MLTRLLTVSEVAHKLNCRKESVRRYIAQGDLPALVLPGGSYRIREDDLSAFLQPVFPKAHANRGS